METVRFIPAGAGNSNRLFVFPIFMTVYPRWRGELPNHGNIYRVDLGLSPLARGTQIGMAAVVAFFRFIPAGAGNSVNPITKNMKPSVYPRWRGEL